MVLYIVLGVTLVALIVVGVIFFLKKRKEKKAAAAAASGEVVAPGGDEISVLIHEAESKLAAAKLEQGAKVGNLPVFLLMGDPGTTKTSVMLHSGLEPELLSGQVYSAGNVAPTRSANFWFSRRAIFAEAGGGMVADAGKWGKLVKRLQPRASVVGKGEQAPRAALVCFDCENFTRPGAPDIAANSARALRARLGEISQAMGINLPVYALFTKADRLPFFTEYVRNLTNEESTQVVGVTLPLVDNRTEGVYAEQETNRLTGSFEQLFRSLADARIEFLAREGDASKLPPAYEFPREFRKVRPSLVQFLVDLCRPSQLTVGPFLRGFYFTGVRPVVINETAPVAAAPQQQAYGGPAGATGIFSARGLPGNPQAPAQAAPAPVLGTRKVPQWLFLAHLFNDILLADRAAMGASGSSTKTSTARRWLFIAAAAVCLLLTTYLTISFFNNRGLEQDVIVAAKGISSNESATGDLASLDVLKRLEVLRQSLEKLVKYHHEGAPWTYHGFLYVGESLYPEARRIYFDRFKQAMFGQTQNAILANLKSLPASPVPEHEYPVTYDSLKAYLMTTSFHEKTTKIFLPPTLMAWWARGRNLDADRSKLAQIQFEFYAEQLLEENPYSSTGDDPAIANARRYLKQFAGMERIYNVMLSEADKAGKPINFNRDFPNANGIVNNGYIVRGAFTAGGKKFMMDAIAHADKYFNGESWVLGDQGTGISDRAGLDRDLKARYSNDWIREWTGYMKAGSVFRYANLRDAANKLRVHASNTSPLLEMSSQASQNTAGPDTDSKIFQPVQYVTPPENTDKFIAASNSNYISALSALQNSIDSIADQPFNEVSAATTLQIARQAESAVQGVAANFKVDSSSAAIQAIVTKLLMDPITYAEGFLKPPPVGPALNTAGAALCKQINPIFQKYPFGSRGAGEATLAEINQVLRPGDGILWQFIDQNLQKYVIKQGTQYAQVPGAPVSLTTQFMNWINNCLRFANAAYKDGAKDPRIAYTVKPVPTAYIDFVKWVTDGNVVQFPGDNPVAKPFVWPGVNGSVQLTMKVKGGTEQSINKQEGLWGVFHLVEQADRRPAADVIEETLTAGKDKQVSTDIATGHPFQVSVEILADPPIFRPGYFSTLGCVANVAVK